MRAKPPMMMMMMMMMMDDDTLRQCRGVGMRTETMRVESLRLVVLSMYEAFCAVGGNG